MTVEPEAKPLDLDAAAIEIEGRRTAWSDVGFVVGPLTWRDIAQGWPYPLVTRSEAVSPDSVGVRANRGTVEFEIVLFDGGWADVVGANIDSGDIQVDGPELDSVEAFGALLDATFKRWSSE
jgi:hypothetical protein